MTTPEPDLGDQHRQGGCLLVLLSCIKSPGPRRLGAQSRSGAVTTLRTLPTAEDSYLTMYRTSAALGQLPAAAIASAAVRLPRPWNQRPGPSVLPAANVAEIQELRSITSWTDIDLSSTPVRAASLASKWLSHGDPGTAGDVPSCLRTAGVDSRSSRADDLSGPPSATLLYEILSSRR